MTAVLVIASDRGMAGAYSASIIREAERLVTQLKSEGKQVELLGTIRFVDQTLRDGQQSWWGMRMPAAISLALAPDLDRARDRRAHRLPQGPLSRRRGRLRLPLADAALDLV